MNDVKLLHVASVLFMSIRNSINVLFYSFLRIMRLCLEHDFKLLAFSQRLRILYSPIEPACVGQGLASGLAVIKRIFATLFMITIL